MKSLVEPANALLPRNPRRELLVGCPGLNFESHFSDIHGLALTTTMAPEMEKEDTSEVSHLSTDHMDQDTSDISEREDREQEQNWLVKWAKTSEQSSAWYLLFRVFIFNALTGINFVIFGLLYVEYSIYFEESKAVLGLIRSFEMGATVLGST